MYCSIELSCPSTIDQSFQNRPGRRDVERNDYEDYKRIFRYGKPPPSSPPPRQFVLLFVVRSFSAPVILLVLRSLINFLRYTKAHVVQGWYALGISTQSRSDGERRAVKL